MSDRCLEDLLPGESSIAMLMTMVGRRHTARPLACAEVAGNSLSFLVSRSTEWAQAVAGNEALVHVTVADDARSSYISLNGAATIDTRPDERHRLWSPAAQAWFEGPDDPDLAVLRFDVSDGQYWDGPNGHVDRAIAVLSSDATRERTRIGTHTMVDAERVRGLDDPGDVSRR